MSVWWLKNLYKQQITLRRWNTLNFDLYAVRIFTHNFAFAKTLHRIPFVCVYVSGMIRVGMDGRKTFRKRTNKTLLSITLRIKCHLKYNMCISTLQATNISFFFNQTIVFKKNITHIVYAPLNYQVYNICLHNFRL